MNSSLIIALPSGIPVFTYLLNRNLISYQKKELSYSAWGEKTIITTALLNAVHLKEEAKNNHFYQREVENEKYLTYFTDDLSVILSGVPEEKTDFYKKKMILVADLFMANYSSNIKTFNGNVDTFKKFATILENNKILNYEKKISLNNVKSKKTSGFPFLQGKIRLVHLFITFVTAIIITMMIVYFSHNQQQMLSEYLTNH